MFAELSEISNLSGCLILESISPFKEGGDQISSWRRYLTFPENATFFLKSILDEKEKKTA